MNLDQAAERLDDWRKAKAPTEAPQALELTDLLAREFPPRQWLLQGLIQERDASMVHAWRGIGKSRFAHGLALALAAGGRFLRWEAPEPRGVLLVDGELPAEVLQGMLAEQMAGMEAPPSAPFRVLARDLLEHLPPLTSPEGQAAVEANLDGVSLLVVDNVSTLGAGGSENDAESWDAWQSWLLALRRRGVAPLLVHHDGKTGGQRGTSRREDVLSQVLHLKRPADYRPAEGARFEVHLTKARHVVGEAAEPIEAALSTDERGRAVWTWRHLGDAQARAILRLSEEGLSQRAIATEIGVGLGTVNRALKRST